MNPVQPLNCVPQTAATQNRPQYVSVRDPRYQTLSQNSRRGHRRLNDSSIEHYINSKKTDSQEESPIPNDMTGIISPCQTNTAATASGH